MVVGVSALRSSDSQVSKCKAVVGEGGHCHWQSSLALCGGSLHFGHLIHKCSQPTSDTKHRHSQEKTQDTICYNTVADLEWDFPASWCIRGVIPLY